MVTKFMTLVHLAQSHVTILIMHTRLLWLLKVVIVI